MTLPPARTELNSGSRRANDQVLFDPVNHDFRRVVAASAW
jgi:hypothetical protein